MDKNLGVLETRAATGWRRYGKIAAVAGGAVVAAGLALLVWRKKTRRPTLKDRLDSLSPESLRSLAAQVAARLKKPLPSVKVTVNEKNQEPGMLESVLRKVAPAVAATASTALLERISRPRKEAAFGDTAQPAG